MIKNKRWETRGISIQRITFLGMFLSFLFVAKYIFGFVAGFETTTFLFIIAALMLPTKDSFILVVGFNLLNLIFYGFGSWWIVYWFIWPVDIILTKIISHMTKNKFVIASTGFLMGLSLIFWFYMSDVILFGNVYALANTITALPINLMGGIGTFILIILLADPILSVSENYSEDLWNKVGYRLNEIKNLNLNIGVSLGIASLGTAGIITLMANNDFFFKWRDSFLSDADVEYDYDALLPEDVYLQYQETLQNDEIAIAVIDDDNYWVDVLPYIEDATLFDMLNLDVDNRHDDETLFTFQAKEFSIGWFVQGYMVDHVHTEWQHDQGATVMFTWDKLNGGSGTTTRPGTLYQFSYN